MKIILIYLFVAALLNSSAAAQQNQAPQKKDEQPIEIQRLNEFSRIVSPKIFEAEKSGNALTVLEALRALTLEYPAAKSFEHGMLMVFLREQTIKLGNYSEALAFADFGQQKLTDEPGAASAQLKDFRPVPATDAISKAAEQIVIVNEAHHVPQHRALTIELLKKLKEKGFTYFAAETLFETDAKLNERGYPTKSSGAYISEPVYGDIVRTAIKLGYKVVPYEAGFAGGPDARERGQAENLKNRIFRKDPQAKVLIHVGYDHNSEATRRNGTKLMAGYLKEYTGIDPLTVDQTEMSERSSPEYEHPLYRFVTKKNFRQPTVFQNGRGEFWALKNSSRDITVFSPRSIYVNARPMWLALNGRRGQYHLPADVCPPAEKSCLVRARFASESIDAVPVDQVEVRRNTKTSLMLPEGDFLIEVENASGRNLKSWRIKR